MAASMSLVPIPSNKEQKEISHEANVCSVIDQWEIHYARFINYDCAAAAVNGAHPSFTPATKSRLRGTWISTSSVASLKLILKRNGGVDDAVLVISVCSRVLEEHHISKLCFSWPQVSCVSGFPAKASRAVFLSYRDGVGAVQKFALHFLTIHGTEKFMSILKEIFETESPRHLTYSDFHSGISSQAEAVPCNSPVQRLEGDLQVTASENTCSHQMPHVFESSDTPELAPVIIRNHEANVIRSSFPPSFTELLKNCHATVSVEKPGASEEDLKTQFMRYLEKTSLKDLMATVENVMDELGDNAMF